MLRCAENSPKLLWHSYVRDDTRTNYDNFPPRVVNELLLILIVDSVKQTSPLSPYLGFVQVYLNCIWRHLAGL